MIGSNANKDYGVTYEGKDIVSNTITTSDQNLMLVLGNGGIIEDVVVRTDGTGLAGSTNFVLKANGVTFFSTAVSGLGANAAVDLDRASVSKTRVQIPGNSYITFAGTVGAGTGAGVATVTVKLRKLDANSDLQAV